MKKIVFAIVIAASNVAFGFGGDFTNVPTQYPTESGWALGMVQMACGLEDADLANAVGTITKANKGVVYSAYVGNTLVAQAWSKKDLIFYKKVCLSVSL